jgi:hypothetical protein
MADGLCNERFFDIDIAEPDAWESKPDEVPAGQALNPKLNGEFPIAKVLANHPFPAFCCQP